MEKVLLTIATIFAAGFLAGCPDDDVCTDCSCDPSLCDGGDGGGDADADADGDTTGERCSELQVDSEPANAAVALEGEPAFNCAATPCVLANIPVGAHTFLLTLDGYDAVPAEVTVTTECAPVNIILYPSVEGEWNLTFHNWTTGSDSSFTWNLNQTGETITGSGSDGCNYAGSITAEGVVHFFSDGCGSTTVTQDGSLVNPDRMEGAWESTSPWGGDSGNWWADRH